jgi:hypothetical protein
MTVLAADPPEMVMRSPTSPYSSAERSRSMRVIAPFATPICWMKASS